MRFEMTTSDRFTVTVTKRILCLFEQFFVKSCIGLSLGELHGGKYLASNPISQGASLVLLA
jgi:hypothetical protein